MKLKGIQKSIKTPSKEGIQLDTSLEQITENKVRMKRL